MVTKKATGKREKAARALFKRRTYSMFKHMKERADKAVASVPFALDELREYVGTYFCHEHPGAMHGAPCRYCFDPLKVKTFSLDHRIPIERGGSWDLSNLDVICASCNTAKGTMSGDEFEAVLRVLRGFDMRTRNEVLGRLKAGACVRRLVLTRRAA